MGEVILIAAVDHRFAIGRDGQLPWHYSDDLKRFKRLTLGHPILMGRKTFESIGKPLPGRRNLVLTRQRFERDGVECFNQLTDALSAVGDSTLFVIGGGEIYAMCLPIATRIELTRVPLSIEQADAYFPSIPESEFRCISQEVVEPLVFERWERVER